MATTSMATATEFNEGFYKAGTISQRRAVQYKVSKNGLRFTGGCGLRTVTRRSTSHVASMSSA